MSQGMHGGSGFVSPQGMPSSHRSSGSGVKDSPRGQLHGPMYRGSQMGQHVQGSQCSNPLSAGLPVSANAATAAAVAAAAAAAAQANRPHQMMQGACWGHQGLQAMSGAGVGMEGAFGSSGALPQGVSADQQAYILQAMANMQIAMSQGVGGSGMMQSEQLQSGPLDDVTRSSHGSGGLAARSGSTGAPMMNRASATGSGNSNSGQFDAPGQHGDYSGWH